MLATLLYRLVSYWLPMIAGPVAYGLFRFSRSRCPRLDKSMRTHRTGRYDRHDPGSPADRDAGG